MNPLCAQAAFPKTSSETFDRLALRSVREQSPAPPAPSVPQAEAVRGTALLITGATGFLGGAIMAKIIFSDDWDSALFLVRAATPEAGVERLAENLRNFGLGETSIQRLKPSQVICGDLADVPSFADDVRLGLVDVVINCAAVASFAKHPLIWPVNTVGTVAFAQAVHRHGRLRRFLQVGTAMAVGPRAENPIYETFETAEDVKHLVDYTASKLEGERMLRGIPGLPLIVARPSIIVGHTQLGCRASGSIYWVFRMGLKMGAFTCDFDERIDVIPVDYAAEALQMLALKSMLKHELYHISAGPEAACSFREIDIAIAPALDRPPIVEYRKLDYEGFSAMQMEFKDIFGPCNRRLMLRAIKLYGAFAGLGMLFDNQRLLAEGMSQPPRFDDYAYLCEDSSRGISIPEQMVTDFK